MRTIAVDWSGAASGAARRIWLAEVVDGALVRLECGRDRAQLAEELIAIGRATPDVVAGLDFAFGVPAWYAAALGAADGPALWATAAREGEGWLRCGEPPWWGRPGKRRGDDDPLTRFRRTEREVPRVAGIAPKSVFQVGGAGAVGTGSVRGMPLLARLHAAGWRIWPFTDDDGSMAHAPTAHAPTAHAPTAHAPTAHAPTVVEIYPRLLTGPVNKSNFSQRAEYLRHRFPTLAVEPGVIASSSEDAFDAAVSALVMAEHAEALRTLPSARDAVERVEGAIWWPGVS
jgi:hypothetical protein